MKKYPFSMTKHAHDVEYRRNFVWNRVNDVYDEYHLTQKEAEGLARELEQLNELVIAMRSNSDGRVAWLTGKEYGLAKECVAWAGERRYSRCKPQNRQYC